MSARRRPSRRSWLKWDAVVDEVLDGPEHLFGMFGWRNPAREAVFDLEFVEEETGWRHGDFGDRIDLLTDQRLHQPGRECGLCAELGAPCGQLPRINGVDSSFTAKDVLGHLAVRSSSVARPASVCGCTLMSSRPRSSSRLRSPYSCDWSLTSPVNTVSKVPACRVIPSSAAAMRSVKRPRTQIWYTVGFNWSSALRLLTHYPRTRGQRSSPDELIHPGDLPSGLNTMRGYRNPDFG